MNMKKALIGLIFICVVTYIGVRSFAQPYWAIGDCMEPAVKDGGYVFLNRVLPYFRSYKIDDIVVFKHEKKVWYSRIVALEKDTIQINESEIVVNGISLDEPGVHRDWNNWQYGTYAIDKPFKVPSGHVYVLSDKLSAHHDDSRVFGPISYSSILG